MGPRNRLGDELGFALVAALVFFLVIAFVTTSLLSSDHRLSRYTASRLNRAHAEWLAENLSTALLSAIKNRDAQRHRFSWNDAQIRCQVDQSIVSYGLQDHAGLVSINHADQATIAGALNAIGLDDGVADRAAAEIVALRSPMSLISEAMLPDFRRGTIESVAELGDLPALGSVPLDRLYAVFSATGFTAQPIPERMPPLLAEHWAVPRPGTEDADNGDPAGFSIRIQVDAPRVRLARLELYLAGNQAQAAIRTESLTVPPVDFSPTEDVSSCRDRRELAPLFAATES